jgi:DNA repair protein RecO (recombination protein O)
VQEQVTGIVIHSLPHSDKSSVSRIFVRGYGLKVFIVRRGGAKKPAGTLFQPLSEISFATSLQTGKSVFSLSSPALINPHHHIPADPGKSSIAIFIAEVLYRTLAEDYINDELYDFLSQALSLLDAEDRVRNFPVWFLMSLSRIYGLDPSSDSPHAVSSLFQSEESPEWIALSSASVYMEFREVNWTVAFRRALLTDLSRYLLGHLGIQREIKSLPVLMELLSG